MLFDMPNLPVDPLAGTRYRLVGLLGRGGTSDVYEATNPKGERFAIKVLRETYRQMQQYATRLLQEGRILASIEHPNLIPVREIGMTRDGRPFLAMPRLNGLSLLQYLDKHGPLEPNVAVKLLAGALDGLHEAHHRDIIHRDVKPGNIFVMTDASGKPERALLFDFGIAKNAGAAAYRTTSDIFLGTPRYVSPEQILGGRIDGRVDIYAMAIVLFETIAARGPYDVLRSAEFNQHIQAHLALTPRRLDDFSPASRALAKVIARALEKAPRKRFQTAAEFASALRHAIRNNTRRNIDMTLEGGWS